MGSTPQPAAHDHDRRHPLGAPAVLLSLLVAAGGCRVGLPARALGGAEAPRVALLLDEVQLDRHGLTWAADYPDWIRAALAEGFADVSLVASEGAVAATGADLVLVVRVRQAHSVFTFYVDQDVEIEALSRDGRLLFEGAAAASSWNWAGRRGDHARAVHNALAPLVEQLTAAPEVRAYLAGPRPSFAERFSVPPAPVVSAPVPRAAPPALEAGPPPTAEGSRARAVVAVFAIEAEGVRLPKQSLRHLHDYLSTRVAATGRFEVVAASEVRRELRRLKAESYEACYDQACQIEIGKEVAAEKSMSVKVLELADGCTTTLNLYDLRKATLESASLARSACDERGILEALDQALLGL